MNSRQTIGGAAAIAAALLPAVSVNADVLVEDFEPGSANESGWSFNVTTPDVIEPFGGFPGGWLHNPWVLSFAPRLTTTAGVDSPFHGNLREKGVVSISIDARTDVASQGAAWYPFALVLRDTKGTADPEDDDYAYSVDESIWVPQVGEGWVHYDFAVPSQSTEATPEGWMGGSYYTDSEGWYGDADWNSLIENVDRVEFWWFHPAWIGLFQDWDVGADNITIATEKVEATCTADVDGDGTVGFTDLVAVLSAWGSCDGCDADVDESGTVDLDDLLTVLSDWGPCR